MIPHRWRAGDSDGVTQESAEMADCGKMVRSRTCCLPLERDGDVHTRGFWGETYLGRRVLSARPRRICSNLDATQATRLAARRGISVGTPPAAC